MHMEKLIISHLLKNPDARIYAVITESGLGPSWYAQAAEPLIDSYVKACQDMIDQKLILRSHKKTAGDPIINYAKPKMMARYHMIRNRRRMMDALI